jgi:hypothetical protein
MTYALDVENESLAAVPEGNRSFAIDNISDYFYEANFTFGDIDFKLQTQLLARAIQPSLKASTSYINFGQCQVADRKDFELKIENLNDELPVDFVIGSVP